MVKKAARNPGGLFITYKTDRDSSMTLRNDIIVMPAFSSKGIVILNGTACSEESPTKTAVTRDSSLTLRNDKNDVILTTVRVEESLPNTTLVAYYHSEVQSSEESSVERCYFCRVMLF